MHQIKCIQITLCKVGYLSSYFMQKFIITSVSVTPTYMCLLHIYSKSAKHPFAQLYVVNVFQKSYILRNAHLDQSLFVGISKQRICIRFIRHTYLHGTKILQINICFISDLLPLLSKVRSEHNAKVVEFPSFLTMIFQEFDQLVSN